MPTFTTKDGKRVSFKAKGEKPKRRRSGGKMAKKSGKRSGRKRSGRKGGYYHRVASKASGIFSGIMGGRIPVTETYLAGGVVAEITNWAPTQRAAFFNALTKLVQGAGFNYKVDGYNVALVLVAANAVASIWPWFGTKLNAILGRFGLRL